MGISSCWVLSVRQGRCTVLYVLFRIFYEQYQFVNTSTVSTTVINKSQWHVLSVESTRKTLSEFYCATSKPILRHHKLEIQRAFRVTHFLSIPFNKRKVIFITVTRGRVPSPSFSNAASHFYSKWAWWAHYHLFCHFKSLYHVLIINHFTLLTLWRMHSNVRCVCTWLYIFYYYCIKI